MADPIDPNSDPAAAEAAALQAELSGDGVIANVDYSPAPVDLGVGTQVFDDGSTLTTNSDGTVTSTPSTDPGFSGNSADAVAGGITQSTKDRATQQQVWSTQQGQSQNGDWRVKLSLAPNSNYLYNASNPGILAPLQATKGVIFPYTPTISTNYRAQYDSYSLTHSNYRGYFYASSFTDTVSITGTFTAQNTQEANYMLAVIHFFRSVTKMFYGQDAERGSPPPLVFLSGMGQYQFNNHACLVQTFSYNLPNNVDYIRAGAVNNVNQNLQNYRPLQSVSGVTAFASIQRLATAITSFGNNNSTPLTPGALPGSPPAPGELSNGQVTYVPTKIDVNIQLLPVQSRQQVSNQFSVKDYASGSLLKGGFW